MIDATEYLNLGYKVVHEFLRQNNHLYHLQEDLEQEAALAIVIAADKWVDRGTIQFSTYCTIASRNAVLKFLRDNENKFRRVCITSLEDLPTPESEDGGKVSWEDHIEGSVVDVPSAIASLPEDCQVYVSLVNEGYSRHEIREKLGIGWKRYRKLKQMVIDTFENKYK